MAKNITIKFGIGDIIYYLDNERVIKYIIVDTIRVTANGTILYYDELEGVGIPEDKAFTLEQASDRLSIFSKAKRRTYLENHKK